MIFYVENNLDRVLSIVFIGLLTPVIVDFSAPYVLHGIDTAFMNSHLGFRVAFLTFGSACIGAYVWATYFVPETANVSLEEIDSLFRSSAGREETDLKRQARLIFVFIIYSP